MVLFNDRGVDVRPMFSPTDNPSQSDHHQASGGGLLAVMSNKAVESDDVFERVG